MARDLDDLDLALAILAGPDGRDSDVPPVPLTAPAPRRLRGLRLAVAPALPGARVSHDVRREVERVAAAAASAGARVDERLPAVDWGELFELFSDLAATITGIFSPGAELRDEQRSLAWYLDALDRRDRLIAPWARFFDDLDGLLLPVAATTAFTHRESGAAVDVDGQAMSYWEVGGALPMCNVTGLPALVAPAGSDRDGLPIGIQIVGAPWSELRLLDIARTLEKADILPGFRPPPAARETAGVP
jgi:amidase